MRIRPSLVLLCGLALASAGLHGQSLAPGTRTWLDAHNCYPEEGRWNDRRARALGASAGPVAIEQDVLWHVDPGTGQGRILVSHGGAVRGNEPSLEAHFFDAMRPRLEAALRADRRSTWPLYALHLDFKSNEPALHAAVWELLGRHERYLTTAERPADPAQVTPFAPGPLIVLTEQGPGQEATFFDRVPVGARLRLFGTVPAAAITGDTPAARARAAVIAAPAALLPTGATAYRRWANFPWAVVEEGGPPAAGAWTPADAARLQEIATRAHAQGLWLRFYTLNGHAPGDSRGWTASYNFGSLDAARIRWRAALDAGVEFVASDQYEDIGALIHPR